jgi:hypothetical protein
MGCGNQRPAEIGPLADIRHHWEAVANQRRPTRVTPPLPSTSPPGPTVSRGPGLIDPRIHRPCTWCATYAITRAARLIDSRIDDTNPGRTATPVTDRARLIDSRINETPSRRADTRCNSSGTRCTGHATHRDAGGRAIDDRGHAARRDSGGGAIDLRVCDGGDCGQADRGENGKVSMWHCECP